LDESKAILEELKIELGQIDKFQEDYRLLLDQGQEQIENVASNDNSNEDRDDSSEDKNKDKNKDKNNAKNKQNANVENTRSLRSRSTRRTSKDIN
jgi:hypothetical protein